MAGDSADILMKFQMQNGTHITGESVSDLGDSKADMAKGFRKGNMFELDSFQFRVGTGGGDTAQKLHAAALLEWHDKGGETSGSVKPTIEMYKAPTGDQFTKFCSGDTSGYPVDLQPVTFSRRMDRASTSLLQYCIRRTHFKSATLIKRKAAGSAAAGEVYLRFDFNIVLLTKVDWDEDDPIQEKYTFICRAVTIHYKPQLPDGSLGPYVQRFWTLSPSLTPTNL